jgi:hypothetical protein
MTTAIIKALLTNKEELTQVLTDTIVRDSVYGTLIAYDEDEESIEIWNGSPDNSMQTNRMHEPDTTLHQLACVQFETPESTAYVSWDNENRRDWAEEFIETIINEQLLEWSKSLWHYFGFEDNKPSDFEHLIAKIDTAIEDCDCEDRITELECWKFQLENPELENEFRDDVESCSDEDEPETDVFQKLADQVYLNSHSQMFTKVGLMSFADDGDGPSEDGVNWCSCTSVREAIEGRFAVVKENWFPDLELEELEVYTDDEETHAFVGFGNFELLRFENA